MHVGVSEGPALALPFLHFADGRPEGAIGADGLVAGCYVHGLFASDAFRAAWLRAFEGGSPLHPSPLPRGERGAGRGFPLSGAHPLPSPLPSRERDEVRGPTIAYETLIEQTLDELAAHLAAHIDMEALLRLAR